MATTWCINGYIILIIMETLIINPMQIECVQSSENLQCPNTHICPDISDANPDVPTYLDTLNDVPLDIPVSLPKTSVPNHKSNQKL